MEPIKEERLAQLLEFCEDDEGTDRIFDEEAQYDDLARLLRELQQRRQADREFREKCVQIISSLPKFRLAAPERTEL